jgi:hypothetical protein
VVVWLGGCVVGWLCGWVEHEREGGVGFEFGLKKWLEMREELACGNSKMLW